MIDFWKSRLWTFTRCTLVKFHQDRFNRLDVKRLQTDGSEWMLVLTYLLKIVSRAAKFRHVSLDFYLYIDYNKCVIYNIGIRLGLPQRRHGRICKITTVGSCQNVWCRLRTVKLVYFPRIRFVGVRALDRYFPIATLLTDMFYLC